MKIAISIISQNSGNYLQNQVRGSGFYIKNLIIAFKKYFPDNEYILFSSYNEIPNNVDIVHIPNFEPFFFSMPLFKKYTSVVTIHDMTPIVFPEFFPSGYRGLLRWNIQKFLLQFYEGIITDSLCSRSDISKYIRIDKSKVHAIYLAPGEEFVRINDQKIFHTKKKFNLPEKFLLYVGDVTWNKNLPRIIDACILSKIPLVLVGKAIAEKNYDRNNMWNKSRIEIQKKIEDCSFLYPLGFVDSADLVNIYNLSSALVMPSLYEGFGLPVLEAMQTGCPVITSREGSLSEIAGDAAYYVDPYNSNDICKAISEMFYDSSLQKKYSEKGLLQVKKFSWEKTASETLSVYKSLL